jgi:IS1 family transposase
MNQLGVGRRAKIIHCLVEGNSIRATCRLTDSAKNTVVKLLCMAGMACANYQDKILRNLKCRRLQLDDIWSFVGCKERTARLKHKAKGFGDIWTWTALDSDTKLVPCWFVGPRDATSAYHFIEDLKSRLACRVQLTTDGLRLYLQAVENAFGCEIDYGMLIKTYGAAPEGPEVRYSPAVCLASYREIISGRPDRNHISTSHTERQNLTMRMSMRRFTRLTNAFSKKAENHKHAIALYFMYYNFCRIHQTLRVTPAMEAGISDHVWGIDEIVCLIDAPECN